MSLNFSSSFAEEIERNSKRLLWRNSKRLLWIQSPAKPERDREKGGKKESGRRGVCVREKQRAAKVNHPPTRKHNTRKQKKAKENKNEADYS